MLGDFTHIRACKPFCEKYLTLPVQTLVEAQMKNLTDPLEAEIQTTTSWWVKIRNRLYITLMQQAVKAIVADVKQKIA